MKRFFSGLIESKTIILFILLGIAVAISVQSYFLDLKDFMGGKYTHYNNYIIFKNSFRHLLDNANLYSYFKSEHGDLYKYSPTFAVFMGLFYYLPDLAGLILWNALNIIVFWYAINSLPLADQKKKTMMILFVMIELVVSVQNSQSNGLVAGFAILTFTSLEKGRPGLAALWIVLGAMIKIFSLAACLLILFYPNKMRSILLLILWGFIFLLLPLIFVDHHQLIAQYENWKQLLMNDHSQSVGFSIYRYTSFILPETLNKIGMLAVGVVILLSPLLKIKDSYLWKIGYLSLLLIWLVVFNHKAESPAFVIAMAGCAIWGMHGEMTKSKRLLLILTFVLTSLTTTDLLPAAVKRNYVDMSLVKPAMSVVILFVIFFELINTPPRIKQASNTNA